MFRAIAALFLFGGLSPVSSPVPYVSEMSLPAVSSLPPMTRLSVGAQDLSASGVMVVDVASGKELYAKRADDRRPMGSLAKLMTAIVILEHHSLTEIVTVPRSAAAVEGNVARLLPGEQYTVSDLLTALLVASANDAAHTLALFHSGTEEAFADEMNERAQVLGLLRTHFENPVGFDSPYQFSTPRELAWLAQFALNNEHIRKRAALRSARIRDRLGEHTITLYSTNQLLTSHPKDFFGLKTGTTDRAGECLISLAEQNGRQYVFVVLKSADRYRDTLQLFSALSHAAYASL